MSTRATLFPERERIPPLRAGDRLTREEFERRWDAMPELKRAELLEGVVHLPSKLVRWDHHGTPHAHLMAWLGIFALNTPGVQAGDSSSIRLDAENEPQPDGAMMIEPESGGQSHVGADGFLEGAPELIVEISASRTETDLDPKFRVYRRAGVREFLIWRVPERLIEWFALRNGEYGPLPSSAGVTRSAIFPGLWLESEAMIESPVKALHVLERGLESPEHAAFVSRLRASANRN